MYNVYVCICWWIISTYLNIMATNIHQGKWYVCISMYVCMYVCMHPCMSGCMNTCTYVGTCTCTRTGANVLYMYMYEKSMNAGDPHYLFEQTFTLPGDFFEKAILG